MPHITTILANEVGVQHQGVQDASIFMGVPVISGLIVGKFKRGRFDRPMVITGENIRAQLGHDPSNPDYNVVLDTLALGVPSVQVLRLEGVVDGTPNPNPNPNPNPDPEPAPEPHYSAVVGISTVGMGTPLTFEFEINGVLYPINVGIDSASYGFASKLAEEPLKQAFQSIGVIATFDSQPAAYFHNYGTANCTVKITAKDAQSDATMFDIFAEGQNEYVQNNLREHFNPTLRREGRTISFTLHPR